MTSWSDQLKKAADTVEVGSDVYTRTRWQSRGDGEVRGRFTLVHLGRRWPSVDRAILAASVASGPTFLPATAYELLAFTANNGPFGWDRGSELMAPGSSVEANPGAPGPKLWLRLHDGQGLHGWRLDFVAENSHRSQYVLCVVREH